MQIPARWRQAGLILLLAAAVASEAGRGSTFTLVLPVADARATAPV